MSPSTHDIAVATGALRAEADIWSAQSGAMGGIGDAMQHVTFNRLQAGIFQLVVNAHDDLATALATRCDEAAGEMRQIAATLHQVADTYDDEERRNVHALRHLY